MLFDIANTLLGSLVMGALLSLTFLFPEVKGFFSESSERLRKILPILVAAWAISAFGNLLATLANLFESSILEMLDFTTIRSYVTQTALGRLQLIQVIAALLLFVIVLALRKVGGAFFAYVIATVGVVAPLFQSHTSQAGGHGLAIGSLIIHVIALSSWVGAVTSLLFMDEIARTLAIKRVGTIATWSVVAVVITGSTSSILRLGFSRDWLTSYGALIGLKIVLLGVIAFTALRTRKALADSTLIRFEVALLVLVMTIGSLLSRFTPIAESEFEYDRVREIVGVAMPAEPTWQRLFFEYEADALMLGVLVYATALYIRGVVALARRGDKWPVGRTISFAIGISLLDYSTSGGLGLYALFSFQYHMIAHMVLSMIAPIFLVLSAPITLALRTLPIGRTSEERGIRGWLIESLHSRVTGIWTNPIVALAIFDGSLFALYFTPLFGDLMSSHFGHLLMNFHFIAAGLLFFHVIVGIDPNPRRVHHLVRVVILLGAISIHAFFSIALQASNTLIDGGYYQSLERPWATDLLADQKAGASIGWAMGEIPIIIALIATFIQWMRSDAREAKRADKNSERDLAEYNDYLRRLAEGRKDS
ncbi:MAG: cytochrome c oxidase assembly protein [Candidatus Nanopelagicaceae bacterium]